MPEKEPEKESVFICHSCQKEVPKTFNNLMQCPYCKSRRPAPAITNKYRNGCLIILIIFGILFLIYFAISLEDPYLKYENPELMRELKRLEEIYKR